MHVPRWKKIADAIHADITQGKLQSGDALPSETDLAAQWQVSRVTAHRAMHELHQQGLVVRRRRYGTVVAGPERRRTGHVAVFFNGTRDFLEQEYLSGIRTGLPDEYDLMICAIRNDPQREAHYLERMSKATDGILCIPTCAPQNTALLRRALQTGTNLVCVDCVPDDLAVDAVISGNYEATREALRFLVQRGHQRVAHFTLDLFFLSSIRERLAAYRQVMLEAGHSDVQPWVRAFPLEVTRDVERLRPVVQDALFTLLHQPNAPTAVLCVNDYVLCATIQACRELGLSLPDDLEIVSYNDCPPFVPFAPNNIHRIVQRAYEMGQIAAERLCRRMRGEEVASEVVRVSCLFYAAEAPGGPSLTQS
jgi:GntR family transcriptional regulator of arabinose operon